MHDYLNVVIHLYQQSCPGHCDANKACVQCRAFGTGPYSDEYCKANCTHVKVVPEVEKGWCNSIFIASKGLIAPS